MDCNNMQNNKGFTIVEAIIVTAVLAAVTTMAFPDFVRFFKIQETTQEKFAMAEIKKALELYAEDKKELPPIGVGVWSAALAPYSSLSESAIENDIWGNIRLYERVTPVGAGVEIVYRGDVIPVDYAVVYSHGPEEGRGDTGVDFDLAGSFDDVADYTGITPTEGDFLVKFTNYNLQVKNYETTVQRLSDISVALANYATAMFNEAILNNVPGAEQLIYYPPSDNTDGPFSAGLYDVTVMAEVAGIVGNAEVRNADVDRADDMVSLMRLLGLPDSHCCDAMSVDPVDDTQEIPFYYYSNPKARSALCGARAGLGDRKLPPRISVNDDDCG